MGFLIKPCVTLYTLRDIQNNGQFLLNLAILNTYLYQIMNPL